MVFYMIRRLNPSQLITIIFVIVINLVGGYILNTILLKSILLSIIIVIYMIIIEIAGLLIWNRMIRKKEGP